MRLLHTSDWHLGHLFCGRRRDGEFRDFLAWLLELIARESVDVLLIAGISSTRTLPETPAPECTTTS